MAVGLRGIKRFLTIAANQPGQSNGMIQGRRSWFPACWKRRDGLAGKFGWKDQDPTILSFSGDAYLNEMGVTNRLKPKDVSLQSDYLIRKIRLTRWVWPILTISLNSSAERKFLRATPH